MDHVTDGRFRALSRSYWEMTVWMSAITPGLPRFPDGCEDDDPSRNEDPVISSFSRSEISENIRWYALQWGSTPLISPPVGTMAL